MNYDGFVDEYLNITGIATADFFSLNSTAEAAEVDSIQAARSDVTETTCPFAVDLECSSFGNCLENTSNMSHLS